MDSQKLTAARAGYGYESMIWTWLSFTIKQLKF